MSGSEDHLKMSLLPFMVGDLQGVPKPLANTGFDLHPSHWLQSFQALANQRPWANAGDHILKKTHIGPDGFQVCLDVQHFVPSEITVKTVDNFIEVEAQHEERQDEHSFVSRHFRRRYKLPEGFKIEDVVSSISSDGILTLKVPPSLSGEGSVRHIPIHQTGPALLNISDRKEAAEKKKAEEKKSVIISK